MVALDAPVQGASIFVDRIDLASKLRLSDLKWQSNGPIPGQSPLTNFQTLTHQISLLAGLHTLINLFTTKPKNNLFYRIKDLSHRISSFTTFLYELPLIYSIPLLYIRVSTVCCSIDV